MLKMCTIQESHLNPKRQTLCAQVIELQKFNYDKIHKVESSIGSDKWFEGGEISCFYKHKYIFLNDIAYYILVRGIKRVPVKTRSHLGNKLINLYFLI